MKKIIFFWIFLALACNNSVTKNAEIVNDLILTENQKDSILKDNLNDYMNAVKTSNYDLAYSYLHKGILPHMQKKYPEYNIDEKYLKNNLLKTAFEIMNKIEDKYNTNFKYKIEEISYKSKKEDILIYVVNAKLEATIKKRRMSLPSTVISFSDNDGKNWTFLEYDKEIAPVFLQENYTNDLTSKIIEFLNTKKK
jgi:ribosome-binding ATPase YchF (GTP1/OBG family)